MKSKSKNNLGLLKNLVNNKYVLYVVALIALLDIMGFILRQEFSSVLLFYLVGMITFYYTKNMTMVLAVPLFVTSLVYFLRKTFNMKEGMKEEIDTDDKEVNEILDEQVNELLDEATNKETESTIQKEAEKRQMQNKNKNKEKYQNQIKLRPGEFNIPNKEQLEKQLGKADQMEQTYDNLEKVIGENGIKSMSSSTKELVRQQKELVKGLKEVTPALNEAMGAIGKIDIGGLSKLFNSVSVGGGSSKDDE